MWKTPSLSPFENTSLTHNTLWMHCVALSVIMTTFMEFYFMGERIAWALWTPDPRWSHELASHRIPHLRFHWNWWVWWRKLQWHNFVWLRFACVIYKFALSYTCYFKDLIVHIFLVQGQRFPWLLHDFAHGKFQYDTANDNEWATQMLTCPWKYDTWPPKQLTN